MGLLCSIQRKLLVTGACHKRLYSIFITGRQAVENLLVRAFAQMAKLKTGIKGLDELIGGGIESGSRNILYGSPGTGKTVFAMQFLWQGLQEGETVSFDVMNKPFVDYRFLKSPLVAKLGCWNFLLLYPGINRLRFKL